MRNTIIVLIVLSFLACSKDYVELNDAEIIDYLADNSLEAIKTESGLYYTIVTQGSVTKPKTSDVIIVNYVGTLLDGTEFDRGSELQFALTGVIAGWTEGLQLIGQGGKINLLIPSHLAYGANPPGSVIPRNAVLLFDVELLQIVE